MEAKGIHILIEALGQLTTEQRGKLKVDIAGKAWTAEDEAYLNRLENRIRELGLQHVVSFIGFQDLGQSLRNYEALVFSSLLEEACPMIVLEAMSNGLLVISSRTGGVTEMVADGVDGILYEPTDKNRLAHLLASLPDLDAGRMRSSAKVRCGKNFNLYQQLERLRSELE